MISFGTHVPQEAKPGDAFISCFCMLAETLEQIEIIFNHAEMRLNQYLTYHQNVYNICFVFIEHRIS